MCETADVMIKSHHYASDDIREKIAELNEKWKSLKNKAATRKTDLDDALQAQQYYADANEAEVWMKEKEPAATSTDYGKDEDSAQVSIDRCMGYACCLT